MAEIMVLDAIDTKLISALQENARISYTALGKKIRASKEIAQYRLSRLIKLGIIKGFITVFSFGYFGFKLLFQLERITPEEEERVVLLLTKEKQVTWVTTCSGSADLACTIMAKDPLEFDSILRKVLQILSPFVKEYRFAIVLESVNPWMQNVKKIQRAEGKGKAERTERVEETEETERAEETERIGKTKRTEKTKDDSVRKIPFDEKDKQIMRVLQNDARISLTKISKETQIPIDTVKYRIERFVALHFIRRYRVVLDTALLGYQRYELCIHCASLPDKQIAAFKEYALSQLAVEYFERTTGSWEIEMTLHVKNAEELRIFVVQLKSQFKNYILSVETIQLFTTYNYTYTTDEIG